VQKRRKKTAAENRIKFPAIVHFLLSPEPLTTGCYQHPSQAFSNSKLLKTIKP
jgi:hypothetical protein